MSTGYWIEDRDREEENSLDLLLGPNFQCPMSLGSRSSCDKLKEVHQIGKQESGCLSLFLSVSFTIPAFLNLAATLTSIIPVFPCTYDLIPEGLSLYLFLTQILQFPFLFT